MKLVSKPLTQEQKDVRNAKRVGVPTIVWRGLSEHARGWFWKRTLEDEAARRAGMTLDEWMELDDSKRRDIQREIGLHPFFERRISPNP